MALNFMMNLLERFSRTAVIRSPPVAIGSSLGFAAILASGSVQLEPDGAQQERIQDRNGAAEILVPDLAEHHQAAKPWTKLDVPDAGRDFKFVIMADRTGGYRPGVFRKAALQVELLQPTFVISIGDLIEGYNYQSFDPSNLSSFETNQELLAGQWAEVMDMLEPISAPVFVTPGNHDYDLGVVPDAVAEQMARGWEAQFGAHYYHFKFQETLFLVLNAEIFDTSTAPWWAKLGLGQKPLRHVEAQKEQMAYVEKVLGENRDVRWTFVILHEPYWQEAGSGQDGQPYRVKDWQRIEEMLADRNYTAFAGHTHTYNFEKGDSDGLSQNKITVATTGGASKLRGVEYGEFDHLTMVSMSENGPSIVNLKLEGILPQEPEG